MNRSVKTSRSRLFGLVACLATALTAAAPALAQSREAVMLDFGTAPDRALAAQLNEAGIEFGEYAGGTSYYASVPSGELEVLRETAGASGVTLTPLPVEDKLRAVTDVERAPEPPGMASPISVVLVPAAGAGDEAVAEVLADFPVEIIDPNEQNGWVVNITLDDLHSLASQPIIESVYMSAPKEVLK